MLRRSQFRIPVIDFEEAHEEWMKNKKKRENGTFVYICGKPLKNGCFCQKIDKKNGCFSHSSWNK